MPARNTKKSTAAGTEERNILDAAFGNEGKKPPAYHVNEKEEPRDERNILDAAFGNKGKKPPQYHVDEKQDEKEDERNILDAAFGNEGKKPPTYHQDEKQSSTPRRSKESDSKDKNERSILDAAFGNEGKKPPTYHSTEDQNDTEERKDWHDAVDKYIDESEDAMNLTAADLRQHLESTVDSATLIESASAIDDYFERRVAIRRRGGIANAMKEQPATATHSTSNGQQSARPAQEKPERNILDAAFGNEGKKPPTYHTDEKQQDAVDGEGEREERKDWHDAVDKFIDSAEEGSTLTVSGLMEHLQSHIDATTTVESASAIEDYFERRIAIRRRGGIENALQDDRTTPVKRDRSVSADSVSGTAAKAAKTA